MNVEQTRHESSHIWRSAGVAITAILVLILVLYQQSVLYLVGLWNQLESGEYAHGYLVLAISLYLVLHNRRKLASLLPSPSYWALPLVVATCLLWLLAVLVDVNMIQSVALLLLVLAVAWLILGNQVIKVLVFPILFIGFAIPVWFPLSPLLQDLTADVVFWLIRFVEVPALRQENTIMLPAGALSIEEACSGLRYLLAALTLGTLYGYLNYETFRARLSVVLISAAAAVLANIFRVFIVVYLGYTSEMQHPLVHDHLMLGWYLFGGLVVVLLLVDTFLVRHYRQAGYDDEVKQTIAECDPPNPVTCKKGILQYSIVLLAGAVIVSLGPVAAYVVNDQSDQQNIHVEVGLPDSIGGWKTHDASSDDWMPVYHGAITHKNVYQKDSGQVTVYIGYYPTQRQGEELINDLNRISNVDVWRTRYPRAKSIQVGEHRVLEQVLEKINKKQRLVWYWYRVAGRITTNRYEAKALQLYGFLIGKRHSSVVAVATDLDNSPESARKLLREFIIEAGSSIAGSVVNEACVRKQPGAWQYG